MIDEKRIAKIVKALRVCATSGDGRCKKCPQTVGGIGESFCGNVLKRKAADLIESLQAQFADKTAMLDAAIAGQETLQKAIYDADMSITDSGAYANERPGFGRDDCFKWCGPQETSEIPCCECGGKVIEFTVPNDIWNLVMRPDGKETDKEYLCLDCWCKALRSKLEELERRRQAAVKCIYDIETYLELGSPKYIRKVIDKWREPQEAGDTND